MQKEPMLYIDKTEVLEKGILGFPSIYIQAAAASGKTTAVQMMLEKHPEVVSYIVSLDLEWEDIDQKLKSFKVDWCKKGCWIVFENLNPAIPEMVYEKISTFIESMPEEYRVIFVGRENPAKSLLKLLWKRKMQMIPHEFLRFHPKEIQQLIESAKSPLKAKDVYAQTEGWAGCVELMIRVSKDALAANQEWKKDARALRESYEIRTYIQEEIIKPLSEEEQEIFKIAAICPWINEEICQEIWGIDKSEACLETLERKGILIRNRLKKCWYLSSMFQGVIKEKELLWEKKFWSLLSAWYEKGGFLKETLTCIQKLEDQAAYRECFKRNYDKIPFLNVPFEDVICWKEVCPEISYLKGMYYFEHQDREALQEERKRLESWMPSNPEEEHKKKEVLLNFAYVDPQYSLDEWLNLLEVFAEKKEKFHLYGILGSGVTFLCGLRDLTGLFACTKKEETQKAQIWKKYFGEIEWKAYCLARLDYYLEVKRDDSVKEEDESVLEEILALKEDSSNCDFTTLQLWRFRLACLYLCCKKMRDSETEALDTLTEHLERYLLAEENEICLRNTEAIRNLYLAWRQKPQDLADWLKNSADDHRGAIDEKNCMEIFFKAKGYIFVNHYERAEKLLVKVIPYLYIHRKFRFYAEALFLQAIIGWKKEQYGQAMKSAIESFVVGGNYRYVDFYLQYGRKGYEVLEAYVEWQKQSMPEVWHKKKKYHYGNVLRMSNEAYIELILRSAKREMKNHNELVQREQEERLTMMETIVLQSLSRGLSNQDICQEQNLKLATVKTHIYSIYKKLQVNSRVQAILKGKELGIIK